MRRLSTFQNQKRKDRIKQFAVSGVLVFIMLFSVLGYGFYDGEGDSNKNFNYNGFEFVNQNGLWILDIGGTKFGFKNNPNEVPRINSLINSVKDYSGKPLYVYSENKMAEYEVYNNLRQVALRMQPACLNEEKCEKNIPVKTCEDNFIIIQESENLEILQNKSCVFIKGPQENLTQITDEFLFKVIGVD